VNVLSEKSGPIFSNVLLLFIDTYNNSVAMYVSTLHSINISFRLYNHCVAPITLLCKVR